MCAAESVETVDRKGLEEMLRRLEAVDLDSVSKVSDSKVSWIGCQPSSLEPSYWRFFCFLDTTGVVNVGYAGAHFFNHHLLTGTR